MMSQAFHPSTLFAGDGDVRALLRSFDWASSPLGSPETWPNEIRVLVRQLLDSQFPMWLAWGEALNMIYNDAYCDILMAKHPQALGQPVTEVWSELRSRITPLFARTLAGVATPLLVVPFDVLRGARPEAVWFNFALTPVRNEHDAVIGMLCMITESTLLIRAQEFDVLRHAEQPQPRPDPKYLM